MKLSLKVVVLDKEERPRGEEDERKSSERELNFGGMNGRVILVDEWMSE